MKKLLEKFVNVSIYHTDVIMVMGPRELLIDYVKGDNVQSKFKDELLANIVTANRKGTPKGSTFFVGTGGGCIIWLAGPEPDVYTHEIAHAAHHILKSKGIDMCDADEAFAYLMEYLWVELSPFTFGLKSKK